jgi:hypothetical protein
LGGLTIVALKVPTGPYAISLAQLLRPNNLAFNSSLQAGIKGAAVSAVQVVSPKSNFLMDFIKNWLPWFDNAVKALSLENILLKRFATMASVLGIITNGYDALMTKGKLATAWALLNLGLTTRLSYSLIAGSQNFVTKNLGFLNNKLGRAAAGFATVFAFQSLSSFLDQKLFPAIKNILRSQRK